MLSLQLPTRTKGANLDEIGALSVSWAPLITAASALTRSSLMLALLKVLSGKPTSVGGHVSHVNRLMLCIVILIL